MCLPDWLTLAADHFVSSGNQFIYLPYHTIKEWVELGFIHVARKKSKHNLSDLMTKNVTTSEIKMLLDVLTGYKRDDTITYIADLIRIHNERTQYVLCALVSKIIIIWSFHMCATMICDVLFIDVNVYVITPRLTDCCQSWMCCYHMNVSLHMTVFTDGQLLLYWLMCVLWLHGQHVETSKL